MQALLFAQNALNRPQLDQGIHDAIVAEKSLSGKPIRINRPYFIF
jgi:hypothetical protein